MAMRGTRVFISRKDFPPQFIDSAQDLLRENGAEPCICSNPSCNTKTDFHVLPSTQQEKVMEYLGQGCNVIGPDCLLRCAKEHRPFPNQSYTCCLAMEGVKVLGTGFEKTEKLEIERLVTAMCGEVETKALANVSFVIAKDVLAAKYKFSLNNIKRPILKIDWLYQCWREHRLVPHEAYRLPPFTGLTICATNVPLEERKEIEDVCVKNGGIYSADLTKKCTHLIAYLPQGDKFKVARRWGTVKIVNRHWFGQCLATKGCLDEELFPVNPGQERVTAISQVSIPPLASPPENSKLEIVMSSATSVVSNTVSSDPVHVIDHANEICKAEPSVPDQPLPRHLKHVETCEVEEENMYLSNCRIYFSGFAAPELRKYVNMVRDGGGTRHMEFGDRVTHIIVGKPTESELRGIRQQICTKSVEVVWSSWLEDCNEQKQEVVITEKHHVADGLLLKAAGSQEITHLRKNAQSQECELDQGVFMKGKNEEDTEKSHHATRLIQVNSTDTSLPRSQSNIVQQERLKANASLKVKAHLNIAASQDSIFKGYMFAICESIPLERREEIVQWIVEGGGSMENESWKDGKRKIDFLVVNHGTKLTSTMMMGNVKPVSSHWIRFCLEEKELLNLDGHVLYQPLQCHVPLPGFQALRFSVSQYEDKDRQLLRNLCFILGAKFTEKLNRKVTHLLCKVRDGQKYEAACKWDIKVTTAEWLFACVTEDTMLPLANFLPKELSPAEKDAGVLGMTQYGSHATQFASRETASQLHTQTETSHSAEFPDRKSTCTGVPERDPQSIEASVVHLSERNKYFLSMQTMSSPDAKESAEETVRRSGFDNANQNSTSVDGTQQMKICSGLDKEQHGSHTFISEARHSRPNKSNEMVSAGSRDKNDGPDVASAIEDLLAQTIKIKNADCSRNGIELEISPDHTTLKRMREQPPLKRTKLHSLEEAERPTSPAQNLPIFDESQMESQMIGYDEDQSGRQLIMERVRTRSMATTGVIKPTSAHKVPSWRNDGLGRLFRVAEGNK